MGGFHFRFVLAAFNPEKALVLCSINVEPLFACRQRGPVSREDDAPVELHRLHAQLHDRVPRAVRGVDRVHVGLHVGRQQGLRTLLPRHCRHREPGGESQSRLFIAFSVYLTASC